MDETQLHVAGASKSDMHIRKMRIVALTGGMAVGVALLFGGYVVYQRLPHMREALRPLRVHLVNRHMPDELRGASLFRLDAGRTRVGTIGSTDVSITESDDLLLSQEVSPQNSARIVLREGIFSVVVQNTLVASSTKPLYSIGVSSDGRYVAYATGSDKTQVLFTRPELISYASLVPNEWTINLVDTQTKTTISLGNGVQPFFIGNDVLAYLTEDGITVYGLSSKETRTVIGNHIASVLPTTLRSPDKLTFAYVEPQRKRMWVYTLVPHTGGIQERATIDLAGGGNSYSLGNAGLYQSRIVDGHVEVWYRTYEGVVSKLVYLAPPTLQLNRLTLGSL